MGLLKYFRPSTLVMRPKRKAAAPSRRGSHHRSPPAGVRFRRPLLPVPILTRNDFEGNLRRVPDERELVQAPLGDLPHPGQYATVQLYNDAHYFWQMTLATNLINLYNWNFYRNSVIVDNIYRTSDQLITEVIDNRRYLWEARQCISQLTEQVQAMSLQMAELIERDQQRG